jgi:hypothetical protein
MAANGGVFRQGAAKGGKRRQKAAERVFSLYLVAETELHLRLAWSLLG